MDKIVFWAEINSVRIETEVDNESNGIDDSVAENLDWQLCEWVQTLKTDEDNLGRYGWRIKGQNGKDH